MRSAIFHAISFIGTIGYLLLFEPARAVGFEHTRESELRHHVFLAPADANDRGETGLVETQILLLLIRLHERIELLACAKLFAIHDKSRPWRWQR